MMPNNNGEATIHNRKYTEKDGQNDIEVKQELMKTEI